MAHDIELTASDGDRLSAYLAVPAGDPRGGFVVIQEIFGVTRHIIAVADQCAASGYIALAHLYPAEHGFNCTDRASFEPACAKLAFERSLAFLRQHIG
jgi:dienelactone hydrolase